MSTKPTERTLQEVLQPCLPLLDAITDAVVVTTLSGEIAWANLATELLFGHSLGDVVGESVRLLVPSIGDGGDELEDVARRLVGSSMEVDALGADFSFFPVSVRCERLHGRDGEVLVWCMASMPAGDEVGRRATEQAREARELSQSLHDQAQSLRRVSEAMRARADERGAFIEALAGELLVPIEAIGGLAEALSMEASVGGDGTLEQDTRKIVRASQHLKTLLEDVIELTQAESRRLRLRYDTIHLPTFLRELARTIRPLARQRNNHLEVRYAKEVDTLVVDVERLRRVLLHLLGNACKWTQGGEVTLTVATRLEGATPWVVFEVADTGIGIPEERQATLFVPFARFGTRGEGTDEVSLGLSLSRSLCRVMGGELAMTSADGQGSVFTVRLPLMTAAAMQVAAPGARASRSVVVSRELHRRKQRDRLDGSLRAMDARRPQYVALEASVPVPPSTRESLARSGETPKSANTGLMRPRKASSDPR